MASLPEGVTRGQVGGTMRTDVSVVDGEVVVDFGRRVDWVGFSPSECRAFIRQLQAAAQKADGQRDAAATK